MLKQRPGEQASPEEPRQRQRPAAPAPHDAVLRMQRTHGNAAVARILQRKDAPPPETPIRAGAGTGVVTSSADSVAAYARPDESSEEVGRLANGAAVKLMAEAGAFYAVDVDGKRGYVRSGELATAIDSLPSDKLAEFERRAADASRKMDEAHQKRVEAAQAAGKPPPKQFGAPLRGTGTAPANTGGTAFPQWFRELQHKVAMSAAWGLEEEEAQQVLDDYTTFYLQSWHGEVPPNVKVLLEYAGRSSINEAKAAAGKHQSVGKFGGGLDGGKPRPNWCTQTTSTGVLEALRSMGYAPAVGVEPFFNNLYRSKPGGTPLMIGAPAAYTAPLMPGDMVMYLFDGCQYGGHTVTVIDDLGDSFTHISGNTGDAIAVGIGEDKRLKSPPKSKRGNEPFVLANCNKVGSKEEMKASTEYIARFDFQGAKLVYSITRYQALFEELETLPTLEQPEQEKLLQRYKLKRVPVAA